MNTYPGGVWPVMLTPFQSDANIDERGLRALVDWYIQAGVSGLFAACQSSEIFNMDAEECQRITRITAEQAAGRVPVIASGITQYEPEEQIKQILAIKGAGADAVILLTNRLAREDEDDRMLLARVDYLLKKLPSDLPLGLYECPQPYKRLLSLPVMEKLAKTGRFQFMKDTCCDSSLIKARLAAIHGTPLKLYNANATTLLQSLLDGAAGYSGVMASFHPQLYVWLCDNKDHPRAQEVQALAGVCSQIERQYYPVNAKYHLMALEKLPLTTFTRTKPDSLLSETFREDVLQMARLVSAALPMWINK